MHFITIPTEQTTAITDAILGLEAMLLILYLQRFRDLHPARTRCWQTLLILTTLASFLGAVAHGFEMSEATYSAIWKPLLLILGMIVANLILAAVYDLFGPETAKKAWPWLLAMAVGFFAVTFVEGVTFLSFIIYEAAGMFFCLFSYSWLALRRHFRGAGLVAAGISLQIAAAVVQASGPFEVHVLFTFDHNGFFHIIGMPATFLMIVGVARGFQQ